MFMFVFVHPSITLSFGSLSVGTRSLMRLRRRLLSLTGCFFELPHKLLQRSQARPEKGDFQSQICGFGAMRLLGGCA